MHQYRDGNSVMKILLLEDELHLRKNIEKFLTLKGHEVDAFENGETLLDGANPNDYDCMILDVNTPEIDGFEVLEYVRSQNVKTPALFISALTDVSKVLKAFDLGAEDYLKKPFDLAELEVRMERIASIKSKKSVIEIDETFSYNLKTRELFKDGQSVALSSTHKKLLYLLFKNQNSLVSFNTIIDYVWDSKEISHSTILSTMRGLKQKLPKKLIASVKGEGYKTNLI